jgi:hypothetical protein
MRAACIVAEFAEQLKKMLPWWADCVDGIVNESRVIVGNSGGGGRKGIELFHRELRGGGWRSIISRRGAGHARSFPPPGPPEFYYSNTNKEEYPWH